MRFTLFGVGEGVLSESTEPLWACTREGRITDASLSARALGIRLGWSLKSARALAPQLVIHEESDRASSTMKRVWHLLWKFSPWLKTVHKNAFYLQVTGSKPPVREVRDLLLELDKQLSEEQRFRVGLAESPDLARGLVEWSRIERVPNAGYYKVGRQQWLVSPSLMTLLQERDTASASSDWVQSLPLQAHWKLSVKIRDQLKDLGLFRVRELTGIPSTYLKRHFGRESIFWPELLQTNPERRLECNYPPVECRQSWQAAAGEMVAIEQLQEILKGLLDALVAELTQLHAGALKLKVVWTTDLESKEYERVPKQPVHDLDALLAAVKPGMELCQGSRLEQLEVYAQDIRPVDSIQMAFILHENTLIPAREKTQNAITRVVYQVNKKFPKGLHRGMHPGFRELRLQAVVDGR